MAVRKYTYLSNPQSTSSTLRHFHVLMILVVTLQSVLKPRVGCLRRSQITLDIVGIPPSPAQIYMHLNYLKDNVKSLCIHLGLYLAYNYSPKVGEKVSAIAWKVDSYPSAKQYPLANGWQGPQSGNVEHNWPAINANQMGQSNIAFKTTSSFEFMLSTKSQPMISGRLSRLRGALCK